MNYLGEIPFVRFLIPYALGIILAWFYPLQLPLNLFIAGLSSFLTCYLLLQLYYRRFKLYRFRWLMGLMFHLFLFLLAYFQVISKTETSNPNHFTAHQAKSLVIQIYSEPILKGDIARFEAEVLFSGLRPVKGKLLVALKVDTTQTFDLEYGELLFIPSAYHEIEPPYNPGEFDFKYFLKTKLIENQCFINEGQIRKLNINKGNSIIRFSLKLRKNIVAHFKKHIKNPESAALAATLIMGYRADLNAETMHTFSATGTMHILSVSGMHVALVFILLGFLLKPMDKIPRMRLIKAGVLITMIWFYALITGFSPSVNRAALMLSFVVLGKAISKSMNTYNLLAISAFFLLLYNPFYIFDIGFQLSYLAVFGLVFLHPHIYETFYVKHKMLDAVWSYTSLSIAAQFITFPLSIYIFHQFPLYFLLSNLLVVLPVTLIMYLGILFVLFIPIAPLLPFLGNLLNILIQFSNQLLSAIAHLPFSNISGIWINQIQLGLLYLITISFVFTWIYKSKIAVFITLSTVLILLAINFVMQLNLQQKEQLVFYSLRKNTAIAFIQGNEYVLISDLVPGDKAYQFSVKPSLDRNGLKLMQWLKPDSAFISNSFCSNGYLLQFGNYRVLRYTPHFNFKRIESPVRVNAVLLSGNPKVKIKQIKNTVRFNLLIIDASNPDYQIKIWLEQSRQLGINCRVLKKSPALVFEQ